MRDYIKLVKNYNNSYFHDFHTENHETIIIKIQKKVNFETSHFETTKNSNLIMRVEFIMPDQYNFPGQYSFRQNKTTFLYYCKKKIHEKSLHFGTTYCTGISFALSNTFRSQMIFSLVPNQ